MHILYLSSAAIPSSSANSLQIMKMCEAMVQEGHEVMLLVPQPPGGEAPQAQSVHHEYGIARPFPIHFVPTPPVLGRRGLAERMALTARWRGADLVYTRGVDFAWAAALLGCRTSLEIHQLPAGRIGPHYLRAFLRNPRCQRLVVISDRLRERLAVEYPQGRSHEIVVAPDAHDPEVYRDLPEPPEARRRLGLAPEQFTAGYFGSLVAGRGVELILDLAAASPQVDFIVAGAPFLDEDTTGGRHPGSLKNIRWLGRIPYREVPRLQAACEVLLMPYQHSVSVQGKGNTAETMSPMKLYEYMACGRLILSSDLPALRVMLSDTNSVLLPPDDRLKWVQAMRRAMSETSWRETLARQAREDVAPHTWRNRVRLVLGGEPFHNP